MLRGLVGLQATRGLRMPCGDETTAVDREGAAYAGSATGAYGDASNLYTSIDRDRVWGVNVDPPESAKCVVKPWDERLTLDVYAESGVDDQMIITIPFTGPVRIQSILLNPGTGDFAPRVRRRD